MALPEGIQAVNLGCGSTYAQGWVNIDNSPNAKLSKLPGARSLLRRLGLLSEAHTQVDWPKNIVVRDLNRPLPFTDNSIDYIYSSHLLEHLTQTRAQALVHEIFRVLKPAGSVRLVVPDLLYLARNYVDALSANPNDAEAARRFLDRLQLSKPGHRDPHLWMYDAPSLLRLLTNTGFDNPHLCLPMQGSVPDLGILDVRPDGSLHVEALKPRGSG